MTHSTNPIVNPEVLLSRYPIWDKAGNKMQQIRVRYCCGHEREWLSLDLGKGWRQHEPWCDSNAPLTSYGDRLDCNCDPTNANSASAYGLIAAAMQQKMFGRQVAPDVSNGTAFAKREEPKDHAS